MVDNHSTTEGSTKRNKVEGPRKHVYAFVFSILLTFIAFATVISGDLNTTFVYIMLLGLAIAQVFIQMSFWMHMKDRGHTFAIIGILFGAIIALSCIIMAVFWTWWS